MHSFPDGEDSNSTIKSKILIFFIYILLSEVLPQYFKMNFKMLDFQIINLWDKMKIFISQNSQFIYILINNLLLEINSYKNIKNKYFISLFNNGCKIYEELYDIDPSNCLIF